MYIMQELKNSFKRLDDWWFDRSRHVSTTGAVELKGLTLAGDGEQSEMYMPTLSATVRLALRNLPITEHQNYTFVDLGSGKGRMLFVAAEYPFRKVEGVEFARELHLEAQRNISRYRSRRTRCPHIESLNLDATNYEFPKDNMVIGLANPFGPEIMKVVLRRMRESAVKSPREIIIMMIFPVLAAVMDPRDWQTLKSTRRYHIYRHRTPA